MRRRFVRINLKLRSNSLIQKFIEKNKTLPKFRKKEKEIILTDGRFTEVKINSSINDI